MFVRAADGAARSTWRRAARPFGLWPSSLHRDHGTALLELYRRQSAERRRARRLLGTRRCEFDASRRRDREQQPRASDPVLHVLAHALSRVGPTGTARNRCAQAADRLGADVMPAAVFPVHERLHGYRGRLRDVLRRRFSDRQRTVSTRYLVTEPA